MNEQVQNILEQSPKVKAAILAGTAALVIGIFWFMFFSESMEKYTEVEGELDELRLQTTEQRAIANNLDRFVAEVEMLEVELKKALTELPDKKEVAELLARVSGVGRDAGLEVKLFKPLDEQKRDYYAEVPVELEVTGTYHQVGTFFDEVGHLDRIVNLDGFHMSEPRVEEQGVKLKTTVVATTFRFLDEDERPKKEAEAEGHKKRKRSRRKK